MKKKFTLKNYNHIQILALGCFVFTLIAAFCSIAYQDEWSDITIIPYHHIIIPVTHIISTIICFYIFIFPKKQIFLYIVMFFQSILASLTGLEAIGVFIFSIFIVLIYLNGNLSPKKQKIIIISLYLAFTIILSGSRVYGKKRFPMAIGCTYFSACAIYCIIMSYKRKLKHIMPLIQQELFISHDIQLPQPGEIMHLTRYDLTDRQRMILFEAVVNNKTYGEIAIKSKLSLSLVKKEMTNITQYFGCKNINSLKIVLNQFEIQAV